MLQPTKGLALCRRTETQFSTVETAGNSSSKLDGYRRTINLNFNQLTLINYGNGFMVLQINGFLISLESQVMSVSSYLSRLLF